MSPLLSFLLDLALKMALTATIVVIISIVVERSGPFVGALIAALPTAAGAAYIILAFEHPPDFIAASAVGSIVSSAGVAIFALIYTVLAQRRGLIVSLGAAICVVCDCRRLAICSVDAARGDGALHRGLCGHYSAELALPHVRSAGEIFAHGLRHSAARAHCCRRRRHRNHGELCASARFSPACSRCFRS